MKAILLTIAGLLTLNSAKAGDTLRVMSYNVLNYGQTGGCGGGSAQYHGYLRTIVAYAHPDVLGLVKMGAVKRSPGDAAGNAPYGFGDSVLNNALNAVFPAQYSYCPVTNTAEAEAISMLFYNQQKLGYLGTVINYARTTDFNLYKFFYRDAALAQTGDTTFVYFLLNHTKSGDGYESYRGTQIDGYLAQLQQGFRRLPNLVNMGDFNTRSTTESCYLSLTAPADTGYRFYETPFYPDAQLSYPADWNNNAAPYSAWLTTSTREGSLPNSCGTGGGAKAWYDHIFISPWLLNGINYMRYIPHSYRTPGNDGQRLGISINDNSTVVNNSAPAAVIDALFRMSNKYPVVADFELRSNTTGVSPQDPDATANGLQQEAPGAGFRMINPAGNVLRILAPAELVGCEITVIVIAADGRTVLHVVKEASAEIAVPHVLPPGVYLMWIRGGQGVLWRDRFVVK